MSDVGFFKFERIINNPDFPFAILIYRYNFNDNGEDEFEEFHVYVGAGGISHIYASDYGIYLSDNSDDECWGYVIKELNQMRVFNDMLNIGHSMISSNGTVQIPIGSVAD